MSFITPIARARGLGSARSGTSHFLAQRISAIALVPLTLWFVYSVLSLVGADLDQVRQWVSSGFHPVALGLLLIATFIHMKLGLQVVIEDYIHHSAVRMVALLGLTFLCWLMVAYGLWAIFTIAFGGS